MLELKLVKEHCRIDEDFTEEDALLRTYIGAAVRYVETWTRRTLYETSSAPGFECDEDALLLGDDVRAAMLLLVCNWYENREAVSMGETLPMPFAFEALLQPYRIYGV
ncbi:head-tail connector protein [Serratia marcescens]